MATIKITMRQLAEIAEKSPGYSVDARHDIGDGSSTFTNIRYEVRPSGRRNRAIVLADIDGKIGRFDSTSVVNILD